MTTTASYGYTRAFKGVPLDEMLQRVTAALQTEGFGVLTEIDVKATMHKKLGVDFRSYRILGACNPELAHQALSAELLLGLLLPCNVAVFEEDDGTINVSLIKPTEMFKVVDNPGMEEMARQVDEKMARVLDNI